MDNIINTVKYINEELSKGRTFRAIESELGYNDRVLYKRLVRKGYKRSDDEYRLFVLTNNYNSEVSTTNNQNNSVPEAKVDINDKLAGKVPPLSPKDFQRLKDLLNRYEDLMCMLDNNTTYT